MVDQTTSTRVFAQEPGVDFPQALVDGLRARFCDAPPDSMARVHLIVNTRRMARRIHEIFNTGSASLLPKISLLTDLGDMHLLDTIPPAVSALRRRLELTQLVARLLDQQPDLAARSSLYDLADSLAELLDEMEGEGVPPSAIQSLDVSDLSGHWERAQAFIKITAEFFDNDDAGLDAQARQRRVIQTLIARWEKYPPSHPVILAGSTGSRGTTLDLMQAVARLPQGALVLPGFDFDLPHDVWAKLKDPDHSFAVEDHPQYRFSHLMRRLGLMPSDIAKWHDTSAPSEARNKAVSLALRPAPVTDAWLSEGPELPDIQSGFAGVTLVEAPSPRAEALAIAMRLRQAAEEGKRAALITPDRMLTRQVTAALDRWGVLPDDSAGLPLQLSPPGRFLRHVTQLFQRRLTTDQLLSILKHPLCHSAGERGPHLLATRELELHLRRKGTPYPDANSLRAWQSARQDVDETWISWLVECFCDQAISGTRALTQWVTHLLEKAERVAGEDGELWKRKAGQDAHTLMQELSDQAAHGGKMTAAEFGDLLGAVLSRGDVRDRDAPHPLIMIWGTLEARVQGADLLILGGLNEGTWPEAAKPDPWLNRSMRQRAGLLMPDRRIGLSAHDFQQAIAAPDVWLTRSVRSDDAQTVPSRWVNRLTNMLGGLKDAGGVDAVNAMRARGDQWLSWADTLEEAPVIAPAARPSPKPPRSARPTQMSVTEIKRLIRDPYAIYAKHVLNLRPLDPLVRLPDPRIKGIVVHDLLESYVAALDDGSACLTADSFMKWAKAILERDVPWPTARVLWLGQLEKRAEWFVASEEDRRAHAQRLASEVQAKRTIANPDFTLTARADRIDQFKNGSLIIYDYKTGKPPTEGQQVAFDKQLLLEAALVEAGSFESIPAADVARAVFIGLGAGKEVIAPLHLEPPEKVWAEFCKLMTSYLDEGVGFTARRMMEKDTDTGDFDQLARFGEWDETSDPVPEDLS